MKKPFDIKGHTTVYGGISEDGKYRPYNYRESTKNYVLKKIKGKVVLVEERGGNNEDI